jgi:hypothetical protein
MIAIIEAGVRNLASIVTGIELHRASLLSPKLYRAICQAGIETHALWLSETIYIHTPDNNLRYDFRMYCIFSNAIDNLYPQVFDSHLQQNQSLLGQNFALS